MAKNIIIAICWLWSLVVFVLETGELIEYNTAVLAILLMIVTMVGVSDIDD